MRYMRSAYKILVRNREVNKPYGRPRRAWISEFLDLNWINLAQVLLVKYEEVNEQSHVIKKAEYLV
jgi:hypothetical protein